MTFQPTTAQIETVTAEVQAFTARNGRSPERIEMQRVAPMPMCSPARWATRISSPAYQADGSDWCMASSTLLTDGSHWDTDPVKPWELA